MNPRESGEAPASNISGEQLDHHMEAVRSRLAEDVGVLHARAKAISSRVPPDTNERLLNRALSGKTVGQRVLWLRRHADLVIKAAEDVSPCREGCSHCCHLGTYVAEPEAILIGKAVGRIPRDVPEGQFTRAEDAVADGIPHRHSTEFRERVLDAYSGVPCTFLVDGRCSIYEHRPMACRHLINIDVDDLLCKLVPGENIVARYVNMQIPQVVYVAAMGFTARIADIRDWFPPEA